MAHSYKKFPGFSDNDNRKFFQKRAANRVVRHTMEVSNGKAYRKLYNPWKICDHNCRYYSKADGWNMAEKFDWDFNYKYWIK